MSDTTTNACNQMKSCDACGTEMSVRAAQCPKCGAPNDWIHPAIAALNAQRGKIQTTRQFTYEHNKSEVWGQTVDLSWPCVILAIIVFLLTMWESLTSLWSGFIFGLIGFLIVGALNKRASFRANLCDGSWTSTNDKLWKPVRDILNI